MGLENFSDRFSDTYRYNVNEVEFYDATIFVNPRLDKFVDDVKIRDL